MTAEERLQEILRREAEGLVPTGDGLARIQARIARRRQRRLWLLPSAALATAGALLAFFAFTPDERTTQTLRPGATPTSNPTINPTVGPTTEPTPPTAPDSYSGPAVWPFTSQAEAEAWTEDKGDKPWADSGLEVGRHFVTDYLKLAAVTVRQDCVSCEVLALVAEGREIGTLALAHYSVGTQRVFTVVNVGGSDLTVTTPQQGASVTSPLHVSGRVPGADENINVRLLDDAGTPVAQGGAPAGGEAPWSTTLSWTDRSWKSGAIVALTGSGKDGTVNRLVVLPVTQGSATAGPSFAALSGDHVSLYDGISGTRLRQLTYPPAGKEDTKATWAKSTLAWVRVPKGSSCGGEVDRLDGGTASTVVRSATVTYGSLQLSPSSALLAWSEAPCDGKPGSFVVKGGGAPDRRIAVPSGMVGTVLDVGDDGRLLVHVNERAATEAGSVGIVPAGATSLDGIRAVAPAAECYLASGAAFDGEEVVAFETCAQRVRLARWDADGTRTGNDADVSGLATPRSTSVRDGVVLLQLRDTNYLGDIARYAGGRVTRLVDNKGCVEPACADSPDW